MGGKGGGGGGEHQLYGDTFHMVLVYQYTKAMAVISINYVVIDGPIINVESLFEILFCQIKQ